MSNLKERIKFLRNTLGVSQQELADKVGVSKSSINMYERGEREPSIETMEAIADYFNVDMDYLIGKSNYKSKYAWLDSIKEDDEGFSCSKSEKLHIQKYRALPDEGKKRVDNVLDFEYSYVTADDVLKVSPEEQQRLHDKTIQRYQDEAAGEEALKQYRIKKLIEKMQNEE